MQRAQGFCFFSAVQISQLSQFQRPIFQSSLLSKVPYLCVSPRFASLGWNEERALPFFPKESFRAEPAWGLTGSHIPADKQTKEKILLAIRKARVNREVARSQEITENCFCTHAALLALNLGWGGGGGGSRNSPWSSYKQPHFTGLAQGHRDGFKYSREEGRACLWAFIPCLSPWQCCGISCQLIRTFPCHCPRRKIDLSTGEVGNLPVLTLNVYFLLCSSGSCIFLFPIRIDELVKHPLNETSFILGTVVCKSSYPCLLYQPPSPR